MAKNPTKLRATIDVYVFPGDPVPKTPEILACLYPGDWWREIRVVRVTNPEEMIEDHRKHTTPWTIVVTQSAPPDVFQRYAPIVLDITEKNSQMIEARHFAGLLLEGHEKAAEEVIAFGRVTLENLEAGYDQALRLVCQDPKQRIPRETTQRLDEVLAGIHWAQENAPQAPRIEDRASFLTIKAEIVSPYREGSFNYNDSLGILYFRRCAT